MVKIFVLLCTFFKSISVEPPMILSAIALNIYSITTDLGMYRVMCDKMFNGNNGTELNQHRNFDCWTESLGQGLSPNDTEWWHEAEIQLQQQTTNYFMAVSISAMIPCMLTNQILGAYGDRRGRKGVMLLGLFGLVIAMIPMPFYFALPLVTPIFVAFVICAVAGFTGSVSSIMSAGAAYLADTVKDKEMLTVRMSILAMCTTVGVVIGPLIANALLNAFGYMVAMIVALAVSCLAFAEALIFVKRVKPNHLIETETSVDSSRNLVDVDSQKSIPIDSKVSIDVDFRKSIEIEPKSITIDFQKKSIMSTDQSDPDFVVDKAIDKIETEKSISVDSETRDKRGCCQEVVGVIKEMPHLLIDSWRTLFKKRQGRRRAYIFVSAFIICVYTAMDASFNGGVFMLYVQKEPLSWTQDQVSYFRSVANLIRLIGSTVGVFLFKKMFKMSDSLIILLALASMMAQAILISLATTSWMLYVAAGAGALASLTSPCIQAFVAKIMEPNEIGKAYGAFSLVTSFAYVFSMVAVGAIYHATVAFFPTLIFWICAAILLSVFVPAFWMHLDFSKAAIRKYIKTICGCFRSNDIDEVEYK